MPNGVWNNVIVRPIALLTCCLLAARAPWLIISIPAGFFGLLWFPGATLARWIGLDRTRHGGAHLLAAVALSLTVSPLVLDAIWRQTHQPWVVAGCWWAINVLVIIASRRARPNELFPQQRLFTKRRTKQIFVLIVLWIGACMVLSHYPVQWNDAVSPASPRDFIKHHAILASLADHGLPLSSAFYAEPDAGPYYYYHYFYLIPATVGLLGGPGVPIALTYALTMVAVMATCLGLIYVLTRRLTGGDGSAIFAVFCVALVGGYDAIPVLIRWLTTHTPVLILDSWAAVPWRVHNLLTLTLWGPQHVQPMVTFLLALWLMSHRPRARWWLILGPAMGASIFGTSVYFAMALAPAILLWCIVEAYLDRRRGQPIGRLVAAYGWMAALVVAMSAVQMRGYLAMGQRFEASLTTSWDRYPLSVLGRLLPPGVAANLVDLPWMFLVEYGLRGIACVLVAGLVWKRLLGEPATRLLVLASATGVIAFVTVRSAIHDYDYGFKIGLLPSMALTAMVAGALVVPTYGQRRWWNPLGWVMAPIRWPGQARWIRGVVVVSVLIGLPLGFYEAPGMAVRRLIQDDPTNSEAKAIAFVRDHLPTDAVLQFDPMARMHTIQLVERSIGVMDPDNPEVNVFRPRDMDRFRAALADVQLAASTARAAEAHELLLRHHVTHVYVGTIERDRWHHLDKFDDTAYFRTVYSDSAVSVYALNETEASRPEEN